MFGGVTPKTVQQDYIYGDNDLTAAQAVRYEVRYEGQYEAQGYTDQFVIDYMTWIF